MAQQAAAIISYHFCAPHPLNLSISEKNSLTSKTFFVRDVNGNVVLKVKDFQFSLRGKIMILDATDRPIVTLRGEILTRHNTFKAFKGESSDPKDLIFRIKTDKKFHVNTKLHVFLPNNVSEEVSDYTLKAEGSWHDTKSAVVYATDSSAIIAQVLAKDKFNSGKHEFMVTVYPNTDYVFIVSLIVTLIQIQAQYVSAATSAGI